MATAGEAKAQFAHGREAATDLAGLAHARLTALLPRDGVPSELQAASAAGAMLLDVREYQEWMAGRVAGAVHVPMQDLPGRLDEIPRDRRVVCICRSGNRSG